MRIGTPRQADLVDSATIRAMLRRVLVPCALLLLLLTAQSSQPLLAQPLAGDTHVVAPGDTWLALSYRYGVAEEILRQLNPTLHPQRQPAIGGTLVLPADVSAPRNGQLIRPHAGGTARLAARLNANPWTLAAQAGLASPWEPLAHRPVFLPGGDRPVNELPPGFAHLEVSAPIATVGQGLGVRGSLTGERAVTMQFNSLDFAVASENQRVVGVVGTGAFYRSGMHVLTIMSGDGPAWRQPWLMQDGQWSFQQITLTGSAANIDQASIQIERERLDGLWDDVTGPPQWTTATALPVETYLSLSSLYGVRRSYNGGPYRSYHEGVDFAAYGGTPVMAPAGGTVVLAEDLYVRGGAVIIDHGMGIYSGYYHLSAVNAVEGQVVVAGDLIGAVGTTGLSTGNHLHWDWLINGVWIDAWSWHVSGMNCWLLHGLGRPCVPLQ